MTFDEYLGFVGKDAKASQRAVMKQGWTPVVIVRIIHLEDFIYNRLPDPALIKEWCDAHLQGRYMGLVNDNVWGFEHDEDAAMFLLCYGEYYEA